MRNRESGVVSESKRDDAANHRRVFMQKLTQTLKTKTQAAGWRVLQARRRIYHEAMRSGLPTTYLGELSAQLDFLPSDREPDWYVIQAKAVIADLAQEHRAARARGDGSQPPIDRSPAHIGSVLQAMQPGAS